MKDVLKTSRLDSPRDLERAAELLRGGGTVAFPTETVYGLGANACDEGAVAKIFLAKQRPDWDPLIVHLSSLDQLPTVAAVPEQIQQRVGVLTRAFWPGPLTLLLPRTAAIPDSVTAGRTLVGVRVPAHSTARRLLELAAVPVAAPSANLFGHTSPTTAQHVLADLDGRIDAVLDGGPCGVGVESTVLDPDTMTIFRPGAVTAIQMRALTGIEVLHYAATDSLLQKEALPSPGVGIRHYAPRAELVLVEGVPDALNRAHADAPDAGILLPDGWPLLPGRSPSLVFRWGDWGNSGELAHNLYAGLRALDARGCAQILCPLPTAEGLGAALRDRLEKAARKE